MGILVAQLVRLVSSRGCSASFLPADISNHGMRASRIILRALVRAGPIAREFPSRGQLAGGEFEMAYYQQATTAI